VYLKEAQQPDPPTAAPAAQSKPAAPANPVAPRGQYTH
jgi:hypothetical protein